MAVEGPSAAGKTTWCRAHAGRFVAEYAPTGAEPDGSDPEAQADYWVDVNRRRWTQAVDLERDTGRAVCDSDPLKLHYSWCLAVVGAAPWTRFEREFERCRAAFGRERLGLADVVLVSAVTDEQLRAQRAGDRGRRRRSFELHARLREPLIAWYRAVEQLDPGRVIWTLPDDDQVLAGMTERPARSDPALLDSLVESLPILSRDVGGPGHGHRELIHDDTSRPAMTDVLAQISARGSIEADGEDIRSFIDDHRR